MVIMTLPREVQTLARELRGVFGNRLESLILYGLHSPERGNSADSHGAHPHRPAPHRTLAIVESLTAQDLRAVAAFTKSWHDQGLATPLMLVAHEFERSLDAFPLEFGAILADHEIVLGRGPFDGVSVDSSDLRRAIEVQARSHLLHLREGYLESGGNQHAVAVLVKDSVLPFTALLLSVARLDGRMEHDSLGAARHLERTLGLDPGSMTEIVRLVHIQEISGSEAERLLPSYLDTLQRVVAYVDGWKG